MKPQSALVRGFDDRFYAVHSRNTDVRREDVEAEPQLEVVAVSDEVGLYIVKSTDSRRFFVFGHPEYDTDTLRLVLVEPENDTPQFLFADLEDRRLVAAAILRHAARHRRLDSSRGSLNVCPLLLVAEHR